MSEAARAAPTGWRPWRRRLDQYPDRTARRRQLVLVVVITIALYYALYVGGGVSTLLLADLRMPFTYWVGALALGNLLGAFASLAAGLADRTGRASLVVYGLIVVGLMVLFVIPSMTTRFGYCAASIVVGVVEGVILVATPALVRDFSPQVGRATAMGFWTIGPVLGSLTVSAVTSAMLPLTGTWQSQFRICGVVCLLVAVAAFLGLRELAPALRDQIMVSERDRLLVEARARGLDVQAALRRPFRQLLRPDIVLSALGVSLMLLIYYTQVSFGVLLSVTVFGFTPAEANSLANWSWAANAVALIAAGLASDALRVRKPFMLAGGIAGAAMLAWLLAVTAGRPSYALLATVLSLQAMCLGTAYATWMASFTETVEARNPALIATGLAIWGWLLRLVVTGSFLLLPRVVTTVSALIAARVAVHADPSAANRDALARVAAANVTQWQTWFWICLGGIVFFVACVPLMRGRWRPSAARADAAAHDAARDRELAALGAPVARAA